jgi:hypothetical protein
LDPCRFFICGSIADPEVISEKRVSQLHPEQRHRPFNAPGRSGVNSACGASKVTMDDLMREKREGKWYFMTNEIFEQ